MLELDQSQMVLSCLEFIEPFPPEAVKMLDDRGIHNVVLAPFLLGNGKHATLEMNEILEEVRGQLPGIQLHLAAGLGLDPNLADVVVQRVRELEGSTDLRGVSSIMCVPYLFFPGIILQRNVIGGMEQIKERYPKVAMSVTAPLGVGDKIVAITADRVRQVWNQAVK
jgi:sirohydrochlorin ferrochelatase